MDRCQLAWTLMSVVSGIWLTSWSGPVVLAVSIWARAILLVMATLLSIAIILWAGSHPTQLLFHAAWERMTAQNPNETCKEKGDEPKTAFLICYRLYRWIVMPMGLMNTPEMFMQMMDNLFVDILDKGVVVFLDDILICNTISEEYFELLEKAFSHLYKHEFHYKLKKCSFLEKTTFLGLKITLEGLKSSNAKV